MKILLGSIVYIVFILFLLLASSVILLVSACGKDAST